MFFHIDDGSWTVRDEKNCFLPDLQHLNQLKAVSDGFHLTELYREKLVVQAELDD